MAEENDFPFEYYLNEAYKRRGLPLPYPELDFFPKSPLRSLIDTEKLLKNVIPAPLKGRMSNLSFDSSDEAALNWLKLYTEESRKRNVEAATFIVENDGLFRTLENPVWGTIDGFDVRTLNAEAMKENIRGNVVGIVHTHGKSDSRFDSEFFSEETYENGQKYGDIPLADEFKIPIYLGTPKDTLRKYVPGKGEDKFYIGNLK